ncbi:ATP-binding cassette domain-containing protein [Prochlorothrix hollandica]|uniref:ABC transporter domain-containing protein n=1 Tax=Prochlorothrix hollandica PCC 9006 = CALU 1027 TaxID=317619 RepID=A0A0M2PZ56_PROHO|nr:ATP-binding cassette domain-containing protein [Prochlorothrix hollandica]KKJ00338.1 hypothetical protein PROH_11780 [Prochlorothrix hollandica PCC 9006 = CALU 1027]
METQPKLHLQHLTQIFGPQPQVALEAFRNGSSGDRLHKQFHCTLALADVSLAIAPGEIMVILGLRGSGKSTLVRCLNGLVRPTSGRVLVDGEDLVRADRPRLRQLQRTKLAMVFPTAALLPHCTVLDNVATGLKVQGIKPPQRRTQALDTLEQAGLGQWANHYPSALSQGLQQRVALARALATDPEILLLDEAFSHLDPSLKRDMQGELLHLQASLGKTIILTSQDPDEALRLGNRVAVLQGGRLEQVGTPAELVTHPSSDYIAHLTQTANRAQILTTGSLVTPLEPLVQGQSTWGEAAHRVKTEGLVYVVDDRRCPLGYVQWGSGWRNINSDQAQIPADFSPLLNPKFPQVPEDISLEDSFPLCHWGIPLAVVDGAGQWRGILKPTTLFAHIGRPGRSRSVHAWYHSPEDSSKSGTA